MGISRYFFSSKREIPNFKGTDYGKEKEKESRKNPKNGGDSRTKKMVDSPLYHLFDLSRYFSDWRNFISAIHLKELLGDGYILLTWQKLPIGYIG